MSKPITIDLPDNLAEAARESAQARGESLEDYLVRLLRFDLEKGETEAFFAKRRQRADLGAALHTLTRPRGETSS